MSDDPSQEWACCETCHKWRRVSRKYGDREKFLCLYAAPAKCSDPCDGCKTDPCTCGANLSDEEYEYDDAERARVAAAAEAAAIARRRGGRVADDDWYEEDDLIAPLTAGEGAGGSAAATTAEGDKDFSKKPGPQKRPKAAANEVTTASDIKKMRRLRKRLRREEEARQRAASEAVAGGSSAASRRKVNLITACRAGKVQLVQDLIRGDSHESLGREELDAEGDEGTAVAGWTALAAAAHAGYADIIRALVTARASVNRAATPRQVVHGPQGAQDATVTKEVPTTGAAAGPGNATAAPGMGAGRSIVDGAYASLGSAPPATSAMAAGFGAGRAAAASGTAGASDSHGGASSKLARRTPLQFACEQGHMAAIEALISAGGRRLLLNQRDTLGRAPLHHLAALAAPRQPAGSFAGKKVETRNKGAAADEASDNRKLEASSEHSNAFAGDLNAEALRLLRVLLDKKADPDVALQGGGEDDGATPLLVAANSGCVGAVKSLLVAKANAGMEDGNGVTPLWAAALGQHLEVVRRLVKAPGVDINAQANVGDSPLWAAVLTAKPSTDVVVASAARAKGGKVKKTATQLASTNSCVGTSCQVGCAAFLFFLFSCILFFLSWWWGRTMCLLRGGGWYFGRFLSLLVPSFFFRKSSAR